jgi:hypothetical protein
VGGEGYSVTVAGTVRDNADKGVDSSANQAKFAGFSRSAGSLSAGELLVCELMIDPSVSDTNGEWFEVYVVATDYIDLKGLYVTGSGSFAVGQSVFAAPGAFILLGRNGNSGSNGGVSLDYSYGSALSLPNMSGTLTLMTSSSGSLIDAVSWTGSTAAKSRELKITEFDASSNDNESNWADALAAFGAGDLGTPGQPNDIFP